MTTAGGTSDGDLMALVASGDARATGELYRRFARSIRIQAARACDPDPDDVVQEVMVRLWRSAGSYNQAKGKLSTWVYQCVRRCAIDRFRARKRQRRSEGKLVAIVDNMDSATDDDAARREELANARETLRRAVRHERREDIMVLAARGVTYNGIAAAMGMPRGTVCSEVAAARRAVISFLPGPALHDPVPPTAPPTAPASPEAKPGPHGHA